MIITAKSFRNGYNPIIDRDKRTSEIDIDFGIISLKQGQCYEGSADLEELYLLMSGKIQFVESGKSYSAERDILLTEKPCAFHLSSSVNIKIIALSDICEIALFRAENPNPFDPRFFKPENIKEDHFSAGNAADFTNRTIRTVLDHKTAPFSKFCCGEVIGSAGQWSSYPPHYHTQPEIYHYRFQPSNGFGYSGENDKVFKVQNGDTAALPPMVSHPQVAAPGYEMYYLWAIPHLENDPFTDTSRIYSKEHEWVAG